MPSPSAYPDPSRSPLERLTARNRAVLSLGLVVTVVTALWALWPLGEHTTPVPPAPSEGAAARQRVAGVPSPLPPLDLAAFSAPTWQVPPVPPKPVVVASKPPPPPPPPLKLQLLGIVRDDSANLDLPVYIAAIYDEAADKLLMLRAGDTVGVGGRVARVHADAVEILDHSGPRRLALHQPIAPIPGLLPPAPAATGRQP